MTQCCGNAHGACLWCRFSRLVLRSPMSLERPRGSEFAELVTHLFRLPARHMIPPVVASDGHPTISGRIIERRDHDLDRPAAVGLTACRTFARCASTKAFLTERGTYRISNAHGIRYFLRRSRTIIRFVRLLFRVL